MNDNPPRGRPKSTRKTFEHFNATQCDRCNKWYTDDKEACPHCGEPNPDLEELTIHRKANKQPL